MTYTTLDGRVLDLSNLTDAQRRYFDTCMDAYRSGGSWEHVSRLVEGDANPLLEATGGRITRAVWESPLFQAVRDIEDRAGIRDGSLAPEPGDDVNRDPVAGEAARG